MRYHYTHTGMAKIRKIDNMNIGKSVVRLKLSYIAYASVRLYGHLGKLFWQFPT